MSSFEVSKKEFNYTITRSVFVVAIVAACLDGFENTMISILGKLAIAFVLVFSFFISLQRIEKFDHPLTVSKLSFSIFFPLVLFLLTYIYSLSYSHRGLDIFFVSEMFFIVFFAMLLFNYGSNLYPTKFAINFLLFLVVLNFMEVINDHHLIAFRLNRNPGLYAHRNVLSAINYYVLGTYLIYCVVNGLKVKRLVILGILFTIFVANSRAIYGALFVFAFCYFFWGFLSRYKLLYYGMLYSFIVTLILFSLLITGTFDDYIPAVRDLNVLFFTYTGGGLSSGREDIWPFMVEKILERPWLGYGPAYQPSNFFDTGLSSHNYYLQVLLQVGFIGFTFLMWFFTICWRYFRRYRADKVIRMIASLMLGALFHQIFEVSLTQNHLEQGMFFWFIVGLGLNRVKILHSIPSKEIT